MWEEHVLLVIAVNGTGGYDVILVLAHQGEFCTVIP